MISDAMLHILKPHEVTPHSRMLAIVLFLAIVPVVSFYTGMKYAETVAVVSGEAITLTLVPVTPHGAIPEQKIESQEYTGPWFSIRYPGDFSVVVGSSTPDEAMFVSPDGKVSFFIYSPQWAGETRILEAADGELLVVDETITSTSTDATYPRKDTRWITYKHEISGSYRSFLSVREGYDDDTTVLHRVYGFSYPDQATYEAYRDEYLAFRASLIQYAD